MLIYHRTNLLKQLRSIRRHYNIHDMLETFYYLLNFHNYVICVCNVVSLVNNISLYLCTIGHGFKLDLFDNECYINWRRASISRSNFLYPSYLGHGFKSILMQWPIHWSWVQVKNIGHGFKFVLMHHSPYGLKLPPWTPIDSHVSNYVLFSAPTDWSLRTFAMHDLLNQCLH